MMQHHLSQNRVSRLPFGVFLALGDITRCIGTKTMADTCQPIEFTHSTRCALVTFGERVRAIVFALDREDINVAVASKSPYIMKCSTYMTKFILAPRLSALQRLACGG